MSLMSFGIYVAGYVILIVGVAMGAHLLDVPPQWIVVGVLCMIGAAIVVGVTATRHKGAPPASPSSPK
jgi:protein-S-isoprenylcysteine O-methyltransferase Ste14